MIEDTSHNDHWHTLLPWKGRAILLVDLDAFFASVEQLDHPEWRGKPVIVGGDPKKRGVVSTCSYEARAFGVHSAQASATATRLCPDAIWTQGDFARYAQMSKEVMRILVKESPLLQQVSIDEAFLDVSPGRYTKEHPIIIAQRIQREVSKLGITCSIGLGTSKTVAKIASDMDKPNGLTVVYPATERNFLAPLPIRSISGIGKKTEERLNTYGIHTLGDIVACPDELAKEIFGINAASMKKRCEGIDPVEVVTQRTVKSVSNEMTFSNDICEIIEIKAAIFLLAEKVGRRLRRKNLSGCTVVLKMKYADLSARSARTTIKDPTDDENVFAPILYGLIDELWSPGTQIRLLGVAIGGFGERREQLDFFIDEDEKKEKELRRELVKATDRVKDRFGDGALGFGRDLRFKDRRTDTTPQHKDESD